MGEVAAGRHALYTLWGGGKGEVEVDLGSQKWLHKMSDLGVFGGGRYVESIINCYKVDLFMFGAVERHSIIYDDFAVAAHTGPTLVAGWHFVGGSWT